MSEPHRILVPIDFSGESRSAVERAVTMASIDRGAESGPVGVKICPLHARDFRLVTLDPGLSEPIVSELRTSERGEFQAFCRALVDRGVEISGHFDEREAIHASSLEPGTQLIAFGSRGQTSIQRFLLGSMSQPFCAMRPAAF